jgi:hypothetical protein
MHGSFDLAGSWCVFLCKTNLLSINFFCRQSLATMGRVHLDRSSTSLKDVTCN